MKGYILFLAILLLGFAPIDTFEFTLISEPEFRIEGVVKTFGHIMPDTDPLNPHFNVQVIDAFDRVTHSRNYTVSDIISFSCESDNCTNTVRVLGEPTLIVRVPYNQFVNRIEVTQLSTQKVITIPLHEFSRYCGNNQCDPGEDALTCPEDCSVYLSPTELGVESEQKTSPLVALSAIVGVILLFSLKIWLRRTRHRE